MYSNIIWLGYQEHLYLLMMLLTVNSKCFHHSQLLLLDKGELNYTQTINISVINQMKHHKSSPSLLIPCTLVL